MVIYIPVRAEGAEYWRPVAAEPAEGDTYRITTVKPDDEQWPVVSGDVVRCEMWRFADGFEGLVAIISETDFLPPIS